VHHHLIANLGFAHPTDQFEAAHDNALAIVRPKGGWVVRRVSVLSELLFEPERDRAGAETFLELIV
jgi:hypothetical protein